MNGRQIKRVLLASVLVAVALMGVGAYLIRKQASSQAGSPLGWFILVVGIAGVLSVIAFIAGAYTD